MTRIENWRHNKVKGFIHSFLCMNPFFTLLKVDVDKNLKLGDKTRKLVDKIQKLVDKM